VPGSIIVLVNEVVLLSKLFRSSIE